MLVITKSKLRFCAVLCAIPFLLQPTLLLAKSKSKLEILKHWDKERRMNAIPRDLVLDPQGNAFLKGKGGLLTPYGHNKLPAAKPGSDADITPPEVSQMSPSEGETITNSHVFSAQVVDLGSGVKQVSFEIKYPNNATETFRPSSTGNVYSINLSGFTDSDQWSWKVVAKDRATGGGNIVDTGYKMFTVNTGTTPEPTPTPEPGDYIANLAWPEPNLSGDDWINQTAIKKRTGRIYFEMPTDKRWRRAWAGYVCSGSVVIDNNHQRSLILTAAHCIYDDVNKAFARNVLFIPDQTGTSATSTDTICSNDPIGCWTTEFGVVDENWTNRRFPDNIEWDHGYYVVDDESTQSHSSGELLSLDVTTGAFDLLFTSPSFDYTHAFGYSYSDDPNLMYCAENMTTEGSVNWWLANCDLSGGSSGGPWLQSFDEITGSGVVMSVNSWGYTTSSGMAGPFINTPVGACLYDAANWQLPNDLSSGYAGIILTCQ